MIYFEDVEEGTAISTLVKRPDYQQVVKWAYAQGNIGETHYDRDFARESGLKDVILAGPLMGAFIGQAVEEWAGYVGGIRLISWRNQAMGYPGDTLTVNGKVNKAYIDGDDGLVECLLEVRSQRDDVVISGRCVISLPRKGNTNAS